MKKLPFRPFIGLFAAVAVLLTLSCEVRRDVSSVAADANPVSAKPRPLHAPDGRHVAIYAGEGFGADVAGGGIFAGLITEYGLLSEGGMLFFPESVDEAAEDPALTAIVTLGAPERTARALERLRATRPAVAIISVFPGDEVLSVEAVSGLVIDVPVSSDLLADENASRTEALPAADLSFLLLSAALYAERPESEADTAPIVRFDEAMEAARREIRNPVAGKDWRITQFVDTDTGLKARNHLVIDVLGGNAP